MKTHLLYYQFQVECVSFAKDNTVNVGSQNGKEGFRFKPIGASLIDIAGQAE